MKKLLLTTLIGLAVSAPTFADDALKVGFSNRTLNGAFFNGLTEYMKIHAKEKGFDLIETDARGDMAKQISDVEDMLSQGIDYLILNPQDPAAGIRIAEMAKKRGVPTFILDSDISLDAPVVTRVQANNAVNNIKIGEYAVDQFGDKPMKCVIISGNQGNLVGEARRTNFVRGVMEAELRKYNHTNLTVLSQGWGNWDQQGGLKAMEDLIVANEDMNCIYSEMDDMALGAIRALRAANKLDQVKVYAHDGYKKGIEAVMRGELQATASNNPNALTKTVLDIVGNYNNGQKDYPDYVYIDPILITKDNAKTVYDPKSLY
ncbi:substrate-binding domain-containing protein [Vibrio viridaestus]|uniref:Autoinducer 2-binding periplasmic protein LuxP n=1 Tax=Vibrio viridaestus TaxID=2487322 RepID=A0A3N9TH68_9VIBR|nr:substrate-binding domain-containing protein [Vibrio viridaestus]RQW63641.1 ABC transporter substrate-binding protein [Vibrio viridaestus]